MITAEQLREEPTWILILTGLPAATFWQLVEAVEKEYPTYERQRHARQERKRAVGGGRTCDVPLVIRMAMLLTYLRLPINQTLVAKLFGITQSDVSRDLRRLLPLLKQVLPSPDLWKRVETDQALTEADQLKFADLVAGQVLVDAAEQQEYRAQASATRKAHYSGKKVQGIAPTYRSTRPSRKYSKKLSKDKSV